jgi:hypothetical protein
MLEKGFIITLAVFFSCTTFSYSQTLYTAREHFETVEAEVITNHGNQTRLVMIISLPSVGPYPVVQEVQNGKTDTWIYGFYSPEENLLVTAVASANASLGSYIGELGSEAWPAGGDTTGFYPDWVDSDEAATVWKQSGLESFYETHSNINFEGMVLGFGIDHDLEWTAVATDGIDSLTCTVNALTLDLVECASTTLVDNLNSARDFKLGEAYPNPVSAGQFTQIDLDIGAPMNLTVTVYDAQGREMGVVTNRHVDPQRLQLIIPAELIPRTGIYFIHAVSRTGLISRKLIVTK